MNTIFLLGEARPFYTAESQPSDFTPPLYRLRRHERPVITPETCLVRNCPVCAWRRAGLLDAPTLPTVVRDGPPEAYGPGCNRCVCGCPSDAALALREEATYALGYSHGEADGPENRPTRRWLLDAGLDPAPYLDGYDDACAGIIPQHGPLTVNSKANIGLLWDPSEPDGLPF